ncbi:MAG: hypothetical protein AAF664_07220 [Planctomycetota bacterium]
MTQPNQVTETTQKATPQLARRGFFGRVLTLGLGGAAAYKVIEGGTASAQSPYNRITTMALGEEGNAQPSRPPRSGATTMMVGEEGNPSPVKPPRGWCGTQPTTRAIGEEQSPPPTSSAVGEEGNRPPATTMRVGEEQPVQSTTRAIGEEGQPSRVPTIRNGNQNNRGTSSRFPTIKTPQLPSSWKGFGRW